MPPSSLYLMHKFRPASLNEGIQFCTGDCFNLTRGMKYFNIGWYQCTISSLLLFIYFYTYKYEFVNFYVYQHKI